MGDLEPRYTDETVELLAATWFRGVEPEFTGKTWDFVRPSVRDAYRKLSDLGLKALADAGLLVKSGGVNNVLAEEEPAWYETIMDQRDRAIEERDLLLDRLDAMNEISDIHMNAANNMRPVVKAAMQWQDRLVADHPGEEVYFTDRCLPILLQALHAYRKTLEDQ